MPTTTSRLGIPVPVLSDPANVPSDMLNLADALDAGSNANYSGAAVFVATPGVLGSLPGSPVKGTMYSVNSTPPYLLWYTGEAGPGTAVAPSGWRLVGGVGTNTANISNSNPGNSVSAGVQPVWAALDHRHATPPWSSSQTTAITRGGSTSDGTANAHARADHTHGFATTPVGRMYQNASMTANGLPQSVTHMVQDFVAGGITYTSPGGIGSLTVPSTAKYQVNAQVTFNFVATGGDFLTFIAINGTTQREGWKSAPSGGYVSPQVSDLLNLTAGDVVTMGISAPSGDVTNPGSSQGFLSLSLVSP